MDEATFVAIKLAKEGYGAGDPEKILNMRVDLVLNIVHYEKFMHDYEKAYINLNKEK